MKKFQEKEIKDLSLINGGWQVSFCLSVKLVNAFDGIKGNAELEGDARVTLGNELKAANPTRLVETASQSVLKTSL